MSTPQLLRRDFLTGVIAGGTAGVGSWFLAPTQAHEAMLPLGTAISYAQNGEDLILESLFRLMGLDKPSYLDIGAYEPILGNNTYYFWRKGGRGVLVEPNPDLTAMLRKQRPGDQVLPIGIGVTDSTEADYFISNWPQLNSFDADTAKSWPTVSGGKAQHIKTIKVPLVNINKIFEQNFGGVAPDLISIDTEGFDIYILKSLNFTKYRPKLIITELANDAASRKEVKAYLAERNYSLRGHTAVNAIYGENQALAHEDWL